MTEPAEQFPIGLVGEVSITVTPEVTAKHMGSGAVGVFATPEMVRLMEKASVRAIAEHLMPGQQSVGVMVNVETPGGYADRCDGYRTGRADRRRGPAADFSCFRP